MIVSYLLVAHQVERLTAACLFRATPSAAFFQVLLSTIHIACVVKFFLNWPFLSHLPTNRLFKMNIFRLTGDLAHLTAIIILLLKIWKTRSCSGTVFFLYCFLWQLETDWFNFFFCRNFRKNANSLCHRLRNPIPRFAHQLCLGLQHLHEGLFVLIWLPMCHFSHFLPSFLDCLCRLFSGHHLSNLF